MPTPVPSRAAPPSRPHAAAAPPPSPQPAAPARAPEAEAIDLGATVLPVVLKSYAPHLAAGLIGLVLGWLLRGRRRAR